MKPEKQLWTSLSRHMKGHWDATRHEDAISYGTPDVSWGARGLNGWLELKVISDWPKDQDKPVPLDFRASQRVFLTNRSKVGGPCGILIYVEKRHEYFFFNSHFAFTELGKTFKRREWFQHCTMYASDLVEPEVLLNFFTSPNE